MNEVDFEDHKAVSKALKLSDLAENANFYLEVKKLWWGKDAFEVIIVGCQMFASVVVALLRAFNVCSIDVVFIAILVGTFVGSVVFLDLDSPYQRKLQTSYTEVASL